MELELQKRSMVCYETVLDTCTNHEETADVIVPDSSPDILRILGAFGNVFVKDEEIGDGRYTLTGTVSGWVLYVSEGDLSVRRLEVNIPFVHTFEHSEIASDQIGIYEMRLVSMEAREINPRKVTVRVNTALCAKSYREEKFEFPQHVMGAVEYGVECKTRRVAMYAPIAIKKKNIHVSDDIEMSASQPEFEAPLRYDVRFVGTESKTIGKKAVVKGNACLTCVYLAKNGNVARFKRTLPFSQILEIDELCDDCKLDIKLHAGDLKLDPQYDMSGDVHYFAFSLPIRICAIVWTQSEFDVLDDLYSTKHLLNVRDSEQKIKSNRGHVQKQVSVAESISCEAPPEEVLDTSLCVEPVRKRREEDGSALTNRVQVHILYRANDGTVHNVMGRMEAVCPISVQNAECCTISFESDDVTCTIERPNEIMVKLCIKYEIDEQETVTLETPCLAEIKNDDPFENDCPSVVVRRIRSGETLWKLAKEYRTTIDDIMIANSLESDEIIAGNMILIPKKR